MSRRCAALLALLILVAACQPVPTPTPYPPPQPTATAEPYPAPPSFVAITETYWPYFATAPGRPKLGLAAGGIQEWPETPKFLGLDWGAPSHQWGPYAQGPADFFGLLRHPFIWGITAQELARAEIALAGYEGVVLPYNECDRPDQCGREFCDFRADSGEWDCSEAPELTAAALVAAMDALPAVLWTTPSFSDADRNCVMLAEWWVLFLEMGGDAGRVVGMGYHRYTTGNDSFSAVLDLCYGELEAAGVPLLPVWVTEVGLWFDCGPAGAERFQVWLEKAMEDSRVINLMIYAPRASYPFCPLVNESGLTDYGRAVRDAGLPAVGGYP